VLEFTIIGYHGNKGRSVVNFNDTSKLPDLKTPILRKNLHSISYVSRVIAIFFASKFVTMATRVGQK